MLELGAKSPSQNRNPLPPSHAGYRSGAPLGKRSGGPAVGEGAAPSAPCSGRAWGPNGPQRHGHHPLPRRPQPPSHREPRGQPDSLWGQGRKTWGDWTRTGPRWTLSQTHTPGTEQRTEAPFVSLPVPAIDFLMIPGTHQAVSCLKKTFVIIPSGILFLQ